MIIFDGIEEINIDRPLVFLCGCAYKNQTKYRDRRKILKKYIDKKWTNKKLGITPLTLVIDRFIDKTKIDKHGLKINLIEEIVSNISYCTYIFLDTMSTSYELGQFTNYSYTNNKVEVFVDKQCGSRNNCLVGEYIKMSFSNSLIEYEAEYNARGHIFFKDDKLPNEIIRQVDNDNPKNNNYQTAFPIRLTTEKYNDSIGLFCYRIEENNIIVESNIMTLFYYISSILSRNNYFLKTLTSISSQRDAYYQSFIKFLKQSFLKTFVYLCREEDRPIIFNNQVNIDFKIGNFNMNELLYHFVALNILFVEYKTKAKYMVGSDSFTWSVMYKYHGLDYIFYWYSRLLDSYKKNEHIYSNGFYQKTLVIHGKNRNIYAYQDNEYGSRLKNFHKFLDNNFLAILPSSPSSFAYKKGYNIVSCLNKHFGNVYFIKLDISKYFESIKQTRVSKKIYDYVRECVIKFFDGILMINNIKADVNEIVSMFFVEHRLPIGFSSSPKISDFYLYDMDNKISSIDGITYTRYADDILISSNSKELLERTMNKIVFELKKEKLKVNQKKTIMKQLINDNDSIKFLGVNIVKRNKDKYELTISKKYLLDISKMIGRKDDNNYLSISGRIDFVKNVSERSYELLKTICKKKNVNNEYRKYFK